jgi:hypothetical protein
VTTSIGRISCLQLTRPGSPVEECLGGIMRKIALLLAAALVVSAPLVAASPTLTYAAAKKGKAKAKEVKAKAPSPEEANSQFGRALNDLMVSLGQPWPASDGKGKAKTGKSGKAGKSGGKAKAKKA